MRRAFFGLIAPAYCVDCGARHADPGSSDPLCCDCHADVPWLAIEGRCRLCQDELAEDPIADPSRRIGALCASCAGRHSSLHACLALTAFEGSAETWITRFKYPARGVAGLDPAPPAVLRALAIELAERAQRYPCDRVMPIPLHPRRLRERGFNPAALIARRIGRALGMRVDYDSLERARDTPSQTGLSRVGRRRNVSEAFALRPSARALPARIWLVDDVVTTGATLAEAARVLRQHGVKQVVGLCVARTPLMAKGK